MTVQENITYPLRLRGYTPQECEEKLSKLLAACPFPLPMQNYPYTLSGGKQQLTNILRAVITEPTFLLLDESFSSVDYLTRQHLYQFVQELFLSHNMGIIMVSHDIDELLLLSDDILLMPYNAGETPKPLNVTATRPRIIDRTSTKEFVNLKKSILPKYTCSLPFV